MSKPLALYKDVVLKNALKQNYEMMHLFADEKEEYVEYERETRPNNNTSDLKKYINIAKKIGLGNIEEIEHFDGIPISVEHKEKNENVISYNSGKGLTCPIVMPDIEMLPIKDLVISERPETAIPS